VLAATDRTQHPPPTRLISLGRVPRSGGNEGVVVNLSDVR
jgi:hypothetical protein